MLTLQFIQYAEIEGLGSQKRINKILSHAKDDKIVLLEGRLKKTEESELIQKTMEEINDDFKGIELAVINPESKDEKAFKKIRKLLANFLLGNRLGFTIVGPASIVKEIKQDPNKIQLLFDDQKIDEDKITQKTVKMSDKKNSRKKRSE